MQDKSKIGQTSASRDMKTPEISNAVNDYRVLFLREYEKARESDESVWMIMIGKVFELRGNAILGHWERDEFVAAVNGAGLSIAYKYAGVSGKYAPV